MKIETFTEPPYCFICSRKSTRKIKWEEKAHTDLTLYLCEIHYAELWNHIVDVYRGNKT